MRVLQLEQKRMETVMKKKLLLCILILFVMAPPTVNFIVSTKSPAGFISTDKQDVWIDFFGTLLGGTLTLWGVGWTIEYNESTRKADQKRREQEMVDEFDRRNLEIKKNLSAQYKPIMTICFDSDFVDDIKLGVSKYENFFIQNYIILDDNPQIEQDTKRLVISLSLLNIGRGEARDLTIHTTIITSEGEQWQTVTREHKEVYTSNGINMVFCKKLTDLDWEKYNNMLEKPLVIIFEIDYYDLVGYHHKLCSTVNISRFIHMINEENKIVPYVLVLNPYDSHIINETSDL